VAGGALGRDARGVRACYRWVSGVPMEDAMTALRLTLAALLAVAALATAARACNEECTAGFVFSDEQGVCVRAGPVST